jgi:hypothetical protein
MSINVREAPETPGLELHFSAENDDFGECVRAATIFDPERLENTTEWITLPEWALVNVEAVR